MLLSSHRQKYRFIFALPGFIKETVFPPKQVAQRKTRHRKHNQSHKLKKRCLQQKIRPHKKNTTVQTKPQAEQDPAQTQESTAHKINIDPQTKYPQTDTNWVSKQLANTL